MLGVARHNPTLRLSKLEVLRVFIYFYIRWGRKCTKLPRERVPCVANVCARISASSRRRWRTLKFVLVSRVEPSRKWDTNDTMTAISENERLAGI